MIPTQIHVHKSYPQPDSKLVPGQWLGSTTGPAAGVPGAIVTFTDTGPTDSSSNYWFDPHALIPGNHFLWSPDAHGAGEAGWIQFPHYNAEEAS